MKFIHLFPFILTLSALSYASVTVSSPYNGLNSGSPVHFVASAASNYPISAMAVYVDGKSAYVGYTGSLNTYVSMPVGSHYVVVQAWDATGQIMQASPMTVVVNDGAPANAVTYWNVNQLPGWESCTSCAGPGGNGPTSNISMWEYINSPSMDGKSAQFNMVGSKPYSQAIWWKQLGANPNASNFVYDLWFYLTNPAAAQALEFDVNQSINGQKYIFGTQCDILNHRDWDVWDTAHATWVPTGISCTAPPAYTWNHLTLEFQRVNGQVNFVAVTLNGQKSYINRAFWPTPVNAQELNVAFQMDGNGYNTPYSAWLDEVNLTVW